MFVYCLTFIGFDLSSAYDLVIPKRGKAIVKTDIAIAIPEGTYARVGEYTIFCLVRAFVVSLTLIDIGCSAPRSGLAVKNFIDVGAGVVDYDYRGNVGVVLFNHSDEDFTVQKGDRVAQLILERISMAAAQEVQELSDTARGAGGFGSTGVQGNAVEGEAVKRARIDENGSEESLTTTCDEEVLRVKKLTDLATIPVRGSAHAAGAIIFVKECSLWAVASASDSFDFFVVACAMQFSQFSNVQFFA